MTGLSEMPLAEKTSVPSAGNGGSRVSKTADLASVAKRQGAAAAPSPAAPQTLIPARRKLLPIVFPMVLFGVDEDGAVALAESGAIWAFDLSGGRMGKRKLHFYRDDLLNYREGAAKKIVGVENVISSILPFLGDKAPAAASIRAIELSWRWCLCSSVISELLSSGELREVSPRARGAGISPQVSYSSAFAFLERRVVL
jgi:hypothetical protein